MSRNIRNVHAWGSAQNETPSFPVQETHDLRMVKFTCKFILKPVPQSLARFHQQAYRFFSAVRNTSRVLFRSRFETALPS